MLKLHPIFCPITYNKEKMQILKVSQTNPCVVDAVTLTTIIVAGVKICCKTSLFFDLSILLPNSWQNNHIPYTILTANCQQLKYIFLKCSNFYFMFAACLCRVHDENTLHDSYNNSSGLPENRKSPQITANQPQITANQHNVILKPLHITPGKSQITAYHRRSA